MMKVRITVIFALIMMFLMLTIAANAISVFANSRYPGVVPGQFLHYRYDLYGSGNDAQLLSHYTTVHAWFNITVLSVSGSNVTFHQSTYNGTSSQENTYVFNVETGDFNSTSGGPLYFIIAANLNANDPIYLSQRFESWRINETIITNDYLGLSLETNYMHINNSYTNRDFQGITVNETDIFDLYWHRSTGIYLDQHLNGYTSRSDGAGNVLQAHLVQWLLILSTTPIIPEFPSVFILPLFMIAALLAVMIYRRKGST